LEPGTGNGAGIKSKKRLPRVYKYAFITFIGLQALYIIAITLFYLTQNGGFAEALLSLIMFWLPTLITFILIIFPAALLGLAVTKIKKETIYKDQLIFISIIGVIFILVASQAFIYTPPIKGKIVEAETNRPVSGVKVRVEWYGKVYLVVDTISNTYKEQRYLAKKDGTYNIPAYVSLKVPIFTSLDNEYISFYAHGYKAAKFDNPPKERRIKLKPLKTPKAWFDNWVELEDDLNDDRSPTFKQDLEFLVKDTELFVDRFPKSSLAPEMMDKVAGLYQGYIHQIDKNGHGVINHKYSQLTIKQYIKIIKLYPGTKEARDAELSINHIKKDVASYRKEKSKE